MTKLDPESQKLVDSGAYDVVEDGCGGQFLRPATERSGLNWPASRFFSQAPNPFMKRPPKSGEK